MGEYCNNKVSKCGKYEVCGMTLLGGGDSSLNAVGEDLAVGSTDRERGL
jgi:hypothetical protein